MTQLAAPLYIKTTEELANFVMHLTPLRAAGDYGVSGTETRGRP